MVELHLVRVRLRQRRRGLPDRDDRADDRCHHLDVRAAFEFLGRGRGEEPEQPADGRWVHRHAGASRGFVASGRPSRPRPSENRPRIRGRDRDRADRVAPDGGRGGTRVAHDRRPRRAGGGGDGSSPGPSAEAPGVLARRSGAAPSNAGHTPDRFSLPTITTPGQVVAATTAAVAALTQAQGWSIAAVVIISAGLILAAGFWWAYFLIPSRTIL